MSARIVGVIPARWGSTRFPGKSLAMLAGEPLVCRVCQAAARAAGLDDLWVATDDERIAAAVRAAGFEPIMTPSELPSGTDRIAWALRGRPAEGVINIQGDEPLIAPALIDRLAGVLRHQPACGMATVAVPFGPDEDVGNPAAVKVVCDRVGRALYFSRAPIPYWRDRTAAGPAPRYLRHIGLYAYRRDLLEQLVAEPPCALEEAERLEQLRALDLGAQIQVLETEAAAPGVDTPEDLAVVQTLWRARQPEGTP
ncbi:MAG: 3-deoxy-manno-octulosonate cytidylyltransferase [Candidatus Marinimicrobia bacterium]|nr:3-deoxy-manno-octulosonate cytidylyltransferase [Candidatus Neomarinimicrobiota bacterium]